MHYTFMAIRIVSKGCIHHVHKYRDSVHPSSAVLPVCSGQEDCIRYTLADTLYAIALAMNM